jgi:hypothetical protein
MVIPLPEEEDSPPTTTITTAMAEGKTIERVVVANGTTTTTTSTNNTNNNNNYHKSHETNHAPPTISSTRQNSEKIPTIVQVSRFRSSKQEGRLPWPEDRNDDHVRSCVGWNWKLEFQKWTYSYMGQLLQKTSPPPTNTSTSSSSTTTTTPSANTHHHHQRTKPHRDNNHSVDNSVASKDDSPLAQKKRLQMADLYRIPRSMKSSILVSKFE